MYTVGTVTFNVLWLGIVHCLLHRLVMYTGGTVTFNVLRLGSLHCLLHRLVMYTVECRYSYI